MNTCLIKSKTNTFVIFITEKEKLILMGLHQRVFIFLEKRLGEFLFRP